MTVPATLRRKRKMTSTTRTTERNSSNCTSSTDARMVVVRSVRTDTSTPAGSVRFSCGRSAVMRSTTSMTLAPGWRWTLRITAGVSFIQAACRTFSASSVTVATSLSRTGAPFRYATMTGR
jgi:hypothetical protein